MVGDSGASNHFVGSDVGIFDPIDVNKPISGVVGTITQTATKQGKMVCGFKMLNGTTTRKTIDVKCVSNLPHNLFSITEELSKGVKLSSNDKLDICLVYPNRSILSFDRQIQTRTEWVGTLCKVCTIAGNCVFSSNC